MTSKVKQSSTVDDVLVYCTVYTTVFGFINNAFLTKIFLNVVVWL